MAVPLEGTVGGSVAGGEDEENPGRTAVLQSRIGGNRVLDMLSGEQLPRICWSVFALSLGVEAAQSFMLPRD
jgi:hypothetical protein